MSRPIIFKPNTIHAAKQIGVARKFYNPIIKFRVRDRIYNGVIMKLFATPVVDVVTIIEPPAHIIVPGAFSDFRSTVTGYIQAITGIFGLKAPYMAEWCYSVTNAVGPYISDNDDQLPFLNWKYTAPDPTVFNRVVPEIQWVEEKLEAKRVNEEGEELEPEEYFNFALEYAFFIGDKPFENRNQVTKYNFGMGTENEDPSEEYMLFWNLVYEEAYPIEDRLATEDDVWPGQFLAFDRHLRLLKSQYRPDDFDSGQTYLGNSIFEVPEKDRKLYYDFKFYKVSSSRTYRLYEKFVYDKTGYLFLSRAFAPIRTYFDNYFGTRLDGNTDNTLFSSQTSGYAGPQINCKPSAVLRGYYLELFVPAFSETTATFDTDYRGVERADYNHGELVLLYLKFQITPKPEEDPSEFPENGWKFLGYSVLNFEGTNAAQPTYPDGSGKLQPSGTQVTIKKTGSTLSGYLVTYVYEIQGPGDWVNWSYEYDHVTVGDSVTEQAPIGVNHRIIGYLSIDDDPDEVDEPALNYKDVVSWTVPMENNVAGEYVISNRDNNNRGKKLEITTQPHVFVKNKVRNDPDPENHPEYKAILMLKVYETQPLGKAHGRRSLYEPLGFIVTPYAVDSGAALAVDGETIKLSAAYPKPPEFEGYDVPLDGWGWKEAMKECFVQPVEFCLVNSDTTKILFFQKDRSEFITRSVVTPSLLASELSNAEEGEYPDPPANWQPIYPISPLEGIAYKRDVPTYFIYDEEGKQPRFEEAKFNGFEEVVTNNHRYGVVVSCVQEEYYDENREEYVPPNFLFCYFEVDYIKFETFEPSGSPSPEEYREAVGGSYTTEKGGGFSIPDLGPGGVLPYSIETTHIVEPYCYFVRNDKIEPDKEITTSKLLVGKFYGLALSYRGNGLPRIKLG